MKIKIVSYLGDWNVLPYKGISEPMVQEDSSLLKTR